MSKPYGTPALTSITNMLEELRQAETALRIKRMNEEILLRRLEQWMREGNQQNLQPMGLIR